MIQLPIQRRRLQGLTQIVQFNWPMYVAGAATCVVAATIAKLVPVPHLLRATILIGVAAALFWLIASLIVSFWVYDASPLCGWRWIPQQLNASPTVWLNIHCGFDESTPSLRAIFPGTSGQALDIFDPAEMTEPSILRARRSADPAALARAANYRLLPEDAASCDAAFCLLSAHELRTSAARAELFQELFRVVAPGGAVVVCEHLRDTPNFLAFGPGFLHFHSRASWLETFRSARFELQREFRITPFVAVFVLRKPT